MVQLQQNFGTIYKQRFMDSHNTPTLRQALEQHQRHPWVRRFRLEEIDRKSEHIAKTVTDRSNEVFQRDEAFVGALGLMRCTDIY